ncbi:MAG TPA: hypothetical protein DGT21_02265 [Armatimonadetes bacterium]|jgi:hypothetical protein|nr:hypothetical protein [Armatimonadota bacterium]
MTPDKATDYKDDGDKDTQPMKTRDARSHGTYLPNPPHTLVGETAAQPAWLQAQAAVSSTATDSGGYSL